MSQLGGSLFKIIWAKQHLDELRSETGKYVNSNPYDFQTDENDDHVVVYPAQITRSPRFDMASLVGDCMNNLMAALDYIVWELARKYAGREIVPPPLGHDKPSFPLFADRDKFLSKTNPCRLKDYQFPAPVNDMIKSVQPYNAGYEPLAQLYFLVNEDKHRLPLIVKGELKSGDISVTHRGVDVRAISSATDVRFNTSDPGLAPYDPSAVKVHAQVTPFVALAYSGMKGEPVDRTVERIYLCVDRVVNGFINAKFV